MNGHNFNICDDLYLLMWPYLSSPPKDLSALHPDDKLILTNKEMKQSLKVCLQPCRLFCAPSAPSALPSSYLDPNTLTYSPAFTSLHTPLLVDQSHQESFRSCLFRSYFRRLHQQRTAQSLPLIKGDSNQAAFELLDCVPTEGMQDFQVEEASKQRLGARVRALAQVKGFRVQQVS